MANLRMISVCMVIGMVLAAASCDKVESKLTLKSSPVDDMIAQAQTLYGEGKKLEAKSIYQQVLNEHTDYKGIETVEGALNKLNMDILFSDIQTPQTTIYEVAAGDTLGKIAAKFNETQDLIKVSNGMKSDVVRVGQKLRIWTARFSAHVDKSQNVLMLKSDEEVLKTYHVSTGANNSTPVGIFKIVTKLENPVWFKTGAAIPPESPDNVLGTRWMGFDKEGYGIHGTVQPDKIGQQVTAGCVRMINDEVEELYRILPRNTEVTIVD